MNDESLESLLRAADRSAGRPSDPPADLPGRVRCQERRRRSRLKCMGLLVALTGGYLAGLSTVRVCDALRAPGATPRMDRVASPVLPTGIPNDGGSGPERLKQQREVPHLAGTNQPGPVSIPSAYELMCELGLQHERNGKYRAALDCYRSALDIASEKELAVADGGDTWLLASVKKGRRATYASEKPVAKGDST